MAKRGKSIEWTPEQDKLILKGEKVEGTSIQVASRRYRLKTHYLLELSRYGKKFVDRLSRIKDLGILPKSCNKEFLDSLTKVVSDLALPVRASKKK